MTVTTGQQGTTLYHERPGMRPVGLKALKGLLADHFVGETTILQAGRYKKAAAIVNNSLPTNKQVQSGDLGELFATEYLNAETAFVVPIKKLRWKSDRETSMHGNDVIGVNATVSPVRVLKGECKSRANFSASDTEIAVKSLDKHGGRPNPSTLAFITKRLYEEKRDDEARWFQDLQCAGSIAAKNLMHMIFVFSGTDPTKHLAHAPRSKHLGIKRENVAILIIDHADFVTAVYKMYGA